MIRVKPPARPKDPHAFDMGRPVGKTRGIKPKLNQKKEKNARDPIASQMASEISTDRAKAGAMNSSEMAASEPAIPVPNKIRPIRLPGTRHSTSTASKVAETTPWGALFEDYRPAPEGASSADGRIAGGTGGG